MAIALIAMNACLKIAGPEGESTLPLEELYTPLGNVLKPGEIITEIRIPAISLDLRQQYIKFRSRKSIDFAMI